MKTFFIINRYNSIYTIAIKYLTHNSSNNGILVREAHGSRVTNDKDYDISTINCKTLRKC